MVRGNQRLALKYQVTIRHFTEQSMHNKVGLILPPDQWSVIIWTMFCPGRSWRRIFRRQDSIEQYSSEIRQFCPWLPGDQNQWRDCFLWKQAPGQPKGRCCDEETYLHWSSSWGGLEKKRNGQGGSIWQQDYCWHLKCLWDYLPGKQDCLDSDWLVTKKYFQN